MRGADTLTIEEMRALIGAVAKVSGALAVRDLTLLELLAATGLRVSEVCALRVAQVVENGAARSILHLDAKNTKRGRGGKLPLSERLQGVLVSYVLWLRSWTDAAWLFPGYAGRPVTPRTVQLRIKALAREAGLRKKVSPHSFRKFFIQRLLDGGLDVRTLQELSRHANLASLHSYLAVDEAAANAAVERLL